MSQTASKYLHVDLDSLDLETLKGPSRRKALLDYRARKRQLTQVRISAEKVHSDAEAQLRATGRTLP